MSKRQTNQQPTLRQKKFFAMLRDRAGSDTPFTRDEIAARTGWTVGSVRAYLCEGHFATVLRREGDKLVADKSVLNKTDDELRVEVTQSRIVREQKKLTVPIAQSLATKSKEHMLLALESFNRPTLCNRLDAFVILYSVAWEQILKAAVAEQDGEDAIFTASTRNGRRESISFQKAIDRVFPESNAVSNNIELCKDLRDQSAHLVVDEMWGLYPACFRQAF